MSRIVKGTGWRPLSHVVETKDGKLYLVDSNDTIDCGYETMVFVWEDETTSLWHFDYCSTCNDGGVSNWLEKYRENYSSETAMKKRHFEVCERLEEVLKGEE